MKATISYLPSQVYQNFFNIEYALEKVSLDLVNTNIFNIKTEYEEKFSSLGYKINYVEARKKNTN